jgi:type I restriction enzyme M protein
MKKTAFWELLNLIFCKIYDEKRRFLEAERGNSYRRKFWVGVKEQNTPEGQEKVSDRIKSLFEELKEDTLFKEVFDGYEQINLSPRGLAFVASELAKYSFLEATIDVKGTAYETIVSNTLKQEAGQFFTPRNVIRCMIEMMDPDENTRILDPACGSGGFLVIALDHVRKKIASNMYPELSGIRLDEKYNSFEVNNAVKRYAERMLFGFDFDPDLKKAARMNMVMAGDGHANIFNINSLDYPHGQLVDKERVAPKVAESIAISKDKDFPFEDAMENAYGKFDMIFTNPPFGAKVEVDRNISKRYELGHNQVKDLYGNYVSGTEKSSEAPEVLFIEQCYKFLKPGGKLAIVLPDGILGNPNTESVRAWILRHFKLLASVDLPVETFLPQVGVQASLLFLQKKTSAEKLVDVKDEDYNVFMAIVETVGKDRRGVPVYKRDDDGAELLYNNKKEWMSLDEFGNSVIRSRNERIKHLDDDLPKVSEAYKEFLNPKEDEDSNNK